MAAYFDVLLGMAKDLLGTTGTGTQDFDVLSLPDSMYLFLVSRSINRADSWDNAVANFLALCEAFGKHVIHGHSSADYEQSETNLLLRLFQNSLPITAPFADMPVALPFISRCCLPILQRAEKIYCHKLVLILLENILDCTGSSLFSQPEKIVACVQHIIAAISDDKLHLGVKASLCKFVSVLLSRYDSKSSPRILVDGICSRVVPLLKQCAPVQVANVSAGGVTRAGPLGTPEGANLLHFTLNRTLMLDVLPAIKCCADFQTIKQLWIRLINASEAKRINPSIVCDIANSLISGPVSASSDKANTVDLAWVIITDTRMWTLVQGCLFEDSPVYQKRAMQLLWTVISVLNERAGLDKHAQRQKLRLWELFASIIESLQQFAIHLVEPLWKKMLKYMCKPATKGEVIANSDAPGTARRLLSGDEFAFVPIVLARFFAHVNPRVKVFALQHFMIEGRSSGLWDLVDASFVSEHVMEALNDTSLFRKDAGANFASVVGPFFARYFAYLLRDGEGVDAQAPAQFIWHMLSMTAQEMFASPALRVFCTFLLSLRPAQTPYTLSANLLASDAVPMDAIVLEDGTVTRLRSAFKRSGKSSDDLLRLIQGLLVSPRFKFHSSGIQRLAMLAFLSPIFIFAEFEQVLTTLDLLASWRFGTSLVCAMLRINYTAFASLLHVMKPQQLQDSMPMLRAWCAEGGKAHVSATTLGEQLEILLKTDTDNVTAAVGLARLAYVLGSHKKVLKALAPLFKTLGMCYSQLYLPPGQVSIALEILAEILALCQLLEPDMVSCTSKHEVSFFGDFLHALRSNLAVVQMDSLVHTILEQACSPRATDSDPPRVDPALCTHILALLLQIFPDESHLRENAGKLMTTIKSSLTSMNTGDWMQRCLIVLMELSKCPFVHANTADMRALTIAVGRLDVVKLQGVIGSSTGTGRTRLGGRRRSFLVESEKESDATLYQLKWMVLASLLSSSNASQFTVNSLSASEQCFLAHAVADAIPSIGRHRTLIPAFLALAQLMPMLVKQHVLLSDSSPNVQSTEDKWPDLIALMECSWATYLDLPRSQQSSTEMQVALLKVLFHESLFASASTNQVPADLARFYKSCDAVYTNPISDSARETPTLHIRCLRVKPTKLHPARWRAKDLTVTLLETDQFGLLKQFFAKVCLHSIRAKRLSLLVQFATHLCETWNRETVAKLAPVPLKSDAGEILDPAPFPITNLSALAFIPEIVHFLTLGQYNPASAEPLKPPLKPRQLTRVVVLSWLDGLSSVLDAHPEPAKNGNNLREWLRLRTFVDAIILFLLEENFTPRQNEAYMPGSAMFGTKLRQWQALGVLSRAIHRKLVPAVNLYAWDVLDRLHQPAVRFEVELFLATVCIKFPDLTLRQHIIPRLRDCNTNPQTATSCLVLTAWVFTVMHKQLSEGDNTNLEVYSSCYDDFAAVVSGWLSCPDGLCRTTAQWVTHALFFKTLTTEEISHGVKMSDKDRRFLRQVVDYLEHNKKCGAMRTKQNKLFALIDPVLQSSLAGLLHRGPLNRFQDFTSSPLTVQLRAVMCETFNEFNALQGPMGGPHASSRFAQTASARAFSAEKLQVSSTLELSFTVQKKRRMAETVGNDTTGVPTVAEATASQDLTNKNTEAELHSTLGQVMDRWHEEKEQDKNERNGRQSIIVVASLIDKAPNLGGLARTCEVFRAEELVLNNIKIKERNLFKQTSVTADRWMPMREIRKENLLVYLQQKRREGYTLVGLEQASNSVMLERFEFPKKVILLLGEEKGGIPALLLRLLDVCIEIPQLGLIRSLNVHVSASMLLWEYTRQQRLK